MASNDANLRVILDAVMERRNGRLLSLDKMLLHSPPLARGWNDMFHEIRSNFSVDMKLRELVMCVVAVLNRANYEYEHHLPIWMSVGGTNEQAAFVRKGDFISRVEGLFSDIEWNVIQLTIQMTNNIAVNAELMKQLKQDLGVRNLVEIVAVISAYNMVSRFLVALQITSDYDQPN
jgi:alkylhydroperoxidase family enzyme